MSISQYDCAHNAEPSSPTAATVSGSASTTDANIDLREQLANAGETGPITYVSTPEDLITRLRGVMIDIDPKYLAPHVIPDGPEPAGIRMYHHTVAAWLDRHPVLKKSEVRFSGTGLHVLLRLREPIEFTNTNERKRWAAIVRVIQRILPGDPHAPGITALTRPVGSVNGKSGLEVRRLRVGEPVTSAELLTLHSEIRDRPFATIAGILIDRKALTPCPICRTPGSTLSILDRCGRCYATCGTVGFAHLFASFVASAEESREVRRG